MRYEHDCDSCISLGEFGRFDLYYCTGQGKETVIVRFSDEYPDYYSGIEIAKLGVHDQLTEAYSRAKERGLCS